MSVERGLIWGAAAAGARALGRRDFLGSVGALAAASAAAPLWARGPASYPAPDRELTAPVPGGRVYVRVNGRLDGPRLPVVMIHGGPGGTHSAFLNALPLGDERAVILYDQLDSGRSDHPNDPRNWTVERFTDEVDAVRRALGVKRWHVLGHSWGGTVALEYGDVVARVPQLRTDRKIEPGGPAARHRNPHRRDSIGCIPRLGSTARSFKLEILS